MKPQVLIETARTLVADYKGLLAMDESTPTCNKRFASLGFDLDPDSAAALDEHAARETFTANCHVQAIASRG